jgi:hypothetical protein
MFAARPGVNWDFELGSIGIGGRLEAPATAGKLRERVSSRCSLGLATAIAFALSIGFVLTFFMKTPQQHMRTAWPLLATRRGG